MGLKIRKGFLRFVDIKFTFAMEGSAVMSTRVENAARTAVGLTFITSAHEVREAITA